MTRGHSSTALKDFHGAPKWEVDGGKAGNTADLKEEIETALDRVFLAYLELEE